MDTTDNRVHRPFGELLARLRTQQDLTRVHLAIKYNYLLGPSATRSEYMTEKRIFRLENGQVVKLSRSVIEHLCTVLCCTPSERLMLLITSDHNPFADITGKADEITQHIILFMAWLLREGGNTLEETLRRKPSIALTPLEWLELLESTMAVTASKKHIKIRL